MTQHVQEISPDATLQEAARQMRDLDIGLLPVCRKDKLEGVITDRDIAIRSAAVGQDPSKAHVQDAMTHELIYCFEDDDIQSAIKLMEQRQIRRLPVLDHEKHIVGIVSLGDLATRQSDEHISAEVLQQVSQPSQPHA